VAVKIKLKRLGKIRAPYYRVVVADSRSKRDGRAIEEIGKYHPKQDPSLIEINSERAQYWLSVGAQPTDPVRNLLKITGDWQRFRGEDGAEGTLKTAAPPAGKQDAFAAALKEAHGEAEGAATTSKSRGRRADAKAEKPETRSARATKPARAASGTDQADAGAETEKAGAKGASTASKDEPKAAEASQPGHAAGDSEDGKAGARAPRKRASDAKAASTSGSDKPRAGKGSGDTAGADEAGNGA
jgi:small subunit ribosomal protein S16